MIAPILAVIRSFMAEVPGDLDRCSVMFSGGQMTFRAQMLLHDDCAEYSGADWGNYASQTNFLDFSLRAWCRGLIDGGSRARPTATPAPPPSSSKSEARCARCARSASVTAQ